jgi:hypothetical protein
MAWAVDRTAASPAMACQAIMVRIEQVRIMGSKSNLLQMLRVRREAGHARLPQFCSESGGRGGIRTHEGPREPWRFSRPLP